MLDSRTGTVLDALPVAVLIADAAGRVTHVNAAGRALLGDVAVPGAEGGGRGGAGPTRAGRAVLRALAGHAGRGEPVLDLEVEVREPGGAQRRLRMDLHPTEAGLVGVVRRAPGAGALGLLRRLVSAAGSDAERQARFLADVGRRLAASLDYDTTLESVARAVVPALADWATVRVLDEGGQVRCLRVACASSGGQELAARLERYYAEHPNAAGAEGVDRVLATGQPEVVTAVDDDWLARHARDAAHRALLAELELASLVHVPLLGAGRTVGCITLARTRPAPPYSPSDLALAEEVCDRAVVALENARLFAESETRRREAEAIAEIGRVLAETLDPRQVWQRIADSVRALLHDAPSSALYCFDAETGAGVAMAVSSEPGLDFEWSRFLPAGAGMIGQVAAKRCTLTSPDILADPAVEYPADVRERLQRSSFRAVLAVPLAVQERLLGALTVGAVRGRVFAPSEIRLLETFANQAAVALDNARLFAEAQARRQEAEAARAAAEAANHAKDQFLAVLSHELRTPLTSVLGWVRMLRGGRLAPAEQERALEILERNARLQARLIDELLDVSRIAAGKLELDLRPVDLVAVVADVVENVRQEPGARGVVAAPVLGVRSAPVVGDSVRLQQVFTNLLGNALKFTPRDGRVEVRVTAEEGWVRVDVADTGQGIAPEELPHIFDRFRQTSGAQRGQGGLGLGLAIVRSIVELHGGRVDVDSPGRGRGAVFTVRLPRAASAPVARPAPAAEPGLAAAPLEGVRVLFVDDNADTRALIAAVLASAGARPLLAACARTALDMLARTEVDVLVSDIGMPGLDGHALVSHLRARERSEGRPRVPAIALTAYASASDRARATEAGFQRHIAKPVDPSALIDAIQEVLAGGGSPR